MPVLENNSVMINKCLNRRDTLFVVINFFCRKIGTDMTSCMSIYNVTGDAFKFYYSKNYSKFSIIYPAHGEVYLIQHYVIKFVSDLRQVGDSLGGTPVSSLPENKHQCVDGFP